MSNYQQLPLLRLIGDYFNRDDSDQEKSAKQKFPKNAKICWILLSTFTTLTIAALTIWGCGYRVGGFSFLFDAFRPEDIDPRTGLAAGLFACTVHMMDFVLFTMKIFSPQNAYLQSFAAIFGLSANILIHPKRRNITRNIIRFITFSPGLSFYRFFLFSAIIIGGFFIIFGIPSLFAWGMAVGQKDAVAFVQGRPETPIQGLFHHSPTTVVLTSEAESRLGPQIASDFKHQRLLFVQENDGGYDFVYISKNKHPLHAKTLHLEHQAILSME